MTKIHSIDESAHFVDYSEPDLERIAPDEQVGFGTFVSWLALGAFSWVALFDLIRAAIRWPYWSWIIR